MKGSNFIYSLRCIMMIYIYICFKQGDIAGLNAVDNVGDLLNIGPFVYTS